MYEQYGMGQYPFPWGGVTPPPNWQPQTPPMQQSQQGIQGVRFVSGIEEVKNCTIPLGSKALLMDKEKDRFYLKETDITGVSTVSEFEFKKVEAEAPQEYVTRQEFEQFSTQLSAQLKEQYESVIQRAGQFQQPAQTQPRVDPAAIPSISNVPLNGVYQDDLSRASQEMTRVMTNYRSEYGDLSPELQEFYDWQRTKTLDCMAEVKVLVDSYK